MLCCKPLVFFCEEICALLSSSVSKTTSSFTEKGTTWEDPSGQVMQMDSLPTDPYYSAHGQKQDLEPSIPGKWSRWIAQQKIQFHSKRKPAVKILHYSMITAFWGANYFSMAFDQILQGILQSIKLIWYDWAKFFNKHPTNTLRTVGSSSTEQVCQKLSHVLIKFNSQILSFFASKDTELNQSSF